MESALPCLSEKSSPRNFWLHFTLTWPWVSRLKKEQHVGQSPQSCTIQPLHVNGKPLPNSWVTGSILRTSYCHAELGACFHHVPVQTFGIPRFPANYQKNRPKGGATVLKWPKWRMSVRILYWPRTDLSRMCSHFMYSARDPEPEHDQEHTFEEALLHQYIFPDGSKTCDSNHVLNIRKDVPCPKINTICTLTLSEAPYDGAKRHRKGHG